MHRLVKMVIWLLIAAGTISCTKEEELPPLPYNSGYFYTVVGSTFHIEVTADGGIFEYPMIGKEGEPFIPVQLITYSERQREAPNYLWDKFVREGLVLVGDDYRKSKECESVPNSLDFIYEFMWIKVSTYKDVAGVNGTFRMEVEPNPYNKPRKLCVFLRNYDHGEAFIYQYPNPDGVEPQEEWNEEIIWYLDQPE